MGTTISESTNSLLALSNNLAGAVEQASSAVVAINARERIPSSGVLWRQGLVVTAAHTIRRKEEITIMLPDQRIVPATLIGHDSLTDLAVLKLGVEEPTAAVIGDVTTLKVGHLILAVGRISKNGPSASLGIISGLGGWRSWRGVRIERVIRLDMAIYDGFSGSPLVDTQGRIIGINTSGLSRNSALAIDAATVNRVIDELLVRGHIAQSYIGVGLQPIHLPEALTNRLNLSAQGGVIILSVEAGGPAAQGGLLIGDILVTLDGKAVSNTDDVLATLTPDRVGQTLQADAVRGGELVRLAITVGERPQRGR